MVFDLFPYCVTVKTISTLTVTQHADRADPGLVSTVALLRRLETSIYPVKRELIVYIFRPPINHERTSHYFLDHWLSVLYASKGQNAKTWHRLHRH